MSQNRQSQGHLYKQNSKNESSQYYGNNNINNRSSRSEREDQQNYQKYNNSHHRSLNHSRFEPSYNNGKYQRVSRSRSRGHPHYEKYESKNRDREKFSESYKQRKRSGSGHRPINHSNNHYERKINYSHNQGNLNNNNNHYKRSRSFNKSSNQVRRSNSQYKGKYPSSRFFEIQPEMKHVSRDTREFKYANLNNQNQNQNKSRSRSNNSQYSQKNSNFNKNSNNNNGSNGNHKKRDVSSSSEKSLSDLSYKNSRKNRNKEKSEHNNNNNNSNNIYFNKRDQEFIIDPLRAKKLVEDKKINYKTQNRYLEHKYIHKEYSPVRQYRDRGQRGNYRENRDYRDHRENREFRDHRDHRQYRDPKEQREYRGYNNNHYSINQNNFSRERDRRSKYENNYYNNGGRQYYESNSHRHRAGYRSSSQRNINKPRSIYINNNRYENYNNQKYDKYKSKNESKQSNNQQQNEQYQKKQKKDSENSNSSSSPTSNSSQSHSQSQVSKSNKKDRSKDAGHYKYKKGEIVEGNEGNKYELIQKISDGTFGRVFEVRNLKSNKIEAMKVIRAVDRYIESAKTEISIIQKLQKWDQEDRNRIVRLYDTFPMERTRNYAIVFEKLGPSLFDMIKKNNYKGFSMGRVQTFFKQILEAIGFIHSKGLTHTDLKPENILLRYDRIEKVGGVFVPCQSTNNEIKVIDFGGATFDHEHHSSIINTRQYRAPEVILECGKWWEISDIWSIGCIICELITGDLLFQTHESYEHMSMVEKNSGTTPQWMARQSKLKNDWFKWDEQNKLYIFNWPQNSSSKNSQNRVRDMKTITDLFSNMPNLLDLLKKCLTIDPNERISCKEALKHPFFQDKLQ